MLVPHTVPELLTINEVADLLRVSRSTIVRWRHDGVLTGIKVGGSIRFRRDEIERLTAPQEAAS